MDRLAYQHPSLASGRWREIPFSLQMGNIGSEVSRSLKWQRKGNQKLMDSAIDRALELFDLTISANRNASPGHLQEICRAREEFCDYFFGDNSFHTDPNRLQRYYDQFISLSRG